jgi:NRAMP (natural resistance-associated macrophage protein)-like metal ion transporter
MASGSPVNTAPKTPLPKGRVARFFSILGPGLVTGAADDDPSGVATYSVAGAQAGTSLLWTALLTWPLMAFVQMMCARIGMVTGRGLAGSLRQKFPRGVLIAAAGALFLANTINVGADLAAMADAANMLTGLGPHWFIVPFGVFIGWATEHFRYQRIAAVLKWLALTLFAYVITAFIVRPNWHEVLRDTFVPTWPKDHAAWSMLVALLGTTISPYLFFWQASQEVEEDKAKGKRTRAARIGTTPKELTERRLDVSVGTVASNVVMYFIILTVALTLNRAGHKDIETSRQAAEALRPLAGNLAFLLYTVGILGVGFLSIPTLAGSAAYAFAETFSWKQGLDKSYRGAKLFYAVVILSILFGMMVIFVGISPIKALYWSAVINGLLAPFLLVGILLVAGDSKIMQGQPSSRFSLVMVTLATIVMFAAAVGMFVF